MVANGKQFPGPSFKQVIAGLGLVLVAVMIMLAIYFEATMQPPEPAYDLPVVQVRDLWVDLDGDGDEDLLVVGTVLWNSDPVDEFDLGPVPVQPEVSDLDPQPPPAGQ